MILRTLTKAFLDRETALVVVNNYWDATIGAQLREPLLLLDVLADVDALPCVVLAVCLLELLQQDRSLPAVGCTPGEELDALVRLQAGGSFVSHLGKDL